MEKQKSFKVKSDNKLNPRLKKEVQEVRGLIWDNIPGINDSRFKMTQCKNRPAVIITDSKTGKISTPIGLCDLHGAIQVLNELF